MDATIAIEGRAYPLGGKNIDTDIIIPAEYMKTITRAGLGTGAFETIRAKPGNIFADPRFAGAQILIAGDNFGCGSSREHAAWALVDFGIRAVIAPSFSDIFSGNAFKNGIVTVVLPVEAVNRLLVVAQDSPLTIDLEDCTVTTTLGDRFPFVMDKFRRDCLMQGVDEIDLTLVHHSSIASYEKMMTAQRPWIGRQSSSSQL